MKKFKNNIMDLLRINTSLLLILCIFVQPISAVSEIPNAKYESFEEQISETLDDFYFNGAKIEFYDESNMRINDIILEMKDDYLSNKEETIQLIGNLVYSTTKMEEIENIQPLSVVLPDIGGGGTELSPRYLTKRLTGSIYFKTGGANTYGYATYSFIGRVRVGEYVEFIDLNIADAVIDYDLYEKYKKYGNNFLVDFQYYDDCYGDCSYGCSTYGYVLKYTLSVYIASAGLSTNINNALESYHVSIFAGKYQWFDSADEYYAAFA